MNVSMLTSVCKLAVHDQLTVINSNILVVYTAFIIMLSNISMGSWNPICGEKFLTGHLNIVGALYDPSAFCTIQGW